MEKTRVDGRVQGKNSVERSVLGELNFLFLNIVLKINLERIM
jgi:hypothetical protein